MIALMESAFHQNLGFEIKTDNDIRKDAFLFGEGQGRAVLSVRPENCTAFESVMHSRNIPVRKLGTVTSGDIRVDKSEFGNVGKWRELYGNVLHTYLDN